MHMSRLLSHSHGCCCPAIGCGFCAGRERRCGLFLVRRCGGSKAAAERCHDSPAGGWLAGFPAGREAADTAPLVFRPPQTTPDPDIYRSHSSDDGQCNLS
ncbi:hypothetical protein AAFF_G00278770 [Aldrovandia affinis]|uniref:Uncharacterized protein n=1 Tax=Aldrovandia affinis TaxID=143900 RepID=A0AAD7SRI9_9TELE|nr:hypothetical protein AAFF_G00278770 [Aldrovandia affinis]